MTNTTKKDLKWRLTKLPTPEEVLKLLNEKLITKEEAKDILFTQEEINKCDIDGTEWVGDITKCPTCQEKEDNSTVKVEDLKAEIKFLREMVDKLAENKSGGIITVVREISPFYNHWQWFHPYAVYCGTTAGTLTTSGTSGTNYLTISGDNTTYATASLSGTAGSGLVNAMYTSTNDNDQIFSALSKFSDIKTF